MDVLFLMKINEVDSRTWLSNGLSWYGKYSLFQIDYWCEL